MVDQIDFFSMVRTVDANQPSPLYAQLRDTIREAIEQGKLQPRETLPAEREIVSRMNVSRITVRKAIAKLVEEGLLIRQQGSGTYVASRVEKQFFQLSSFSEDMAARGFDVRNEWIRKDSGTITPDEALTFGLSPGSRVYRLKRVRYANNIPMAVEYATIAGFALHSEDEIDKSLYDALEATGNRPVRALQRMRAVMFEGEQAELLRVTERAPALFIERRGFNQAGRMIELTKSWYCGDAYDFVAEIAGR
jgi:GntR family transcriptional regulator